MKPASTRLSIRQQMLLLAFFACLSMAALSSFQILQTYRSNVENLRREVRLGRNSTAALFAAYIGDIRLELGHLATNHAQGLLTPQTFGQPALQLCAGRPAHRSLTWLDANGTAVATTDPGLSQGMVPPWKPTSVPEDFTVGNIFRTVDGQWLVPMFQPLRSEGKLVGTLALLTKPQAYLQSHRAQTLPKSEVVVMLIQPDGHVVVHSDLPDFFLGMAFPQHEAIFQEHDAGGTEGDVRGYDNRTRVYASARIAGSPWIMRASIDKLTVVSGLIQSLVWNFMLLGLVLAVVLLVANNLAAHIARPAVALATAARESAAGRQSDLIREEGPAEIADTARAFNEMLEQRQLGQTELLASEARYQLLFRNMMSGFALCEIVCDDQGQPVDFRFLEINPAFERLTGRTPQAVVGRLARESIPGLQQEWIRAYGRVALTGEATNFERFSSEIGRHFEIFAFCPRPRQFAVVFNDISDRVRNREALDLANRRYAGLVNSIGGIVWEMTADGRFTFVSQHAERILGHPVSLWLADPNFWRGHMHPDDRTWAPDYSNAEAAAGHDHSLDYRMLHQDGRVVWFRDIVSVVNEGKPQFRLVGVMFDITKQKEADLALQASERRLELALEGAQLGLWDWNVANDTVKFNDRWVTMLEYDPATFENSSASWERLLHPDDRERVLAAVHAHFQAGTTPHYEATYRLKARSGRWVWVMARGRVVERDAQGRSVRAAGTHLDITAAQEAAEEKAALEKKIQETQKLESLGVLAGGIAHDFNNLLTGILGNASLARLEMPPGSPGLHSLAEVEKAAERAANLCKQMLAYSGRGRFVVQRINLNQIIEETTHLLQISIGKGVVIRFKLAPNLPPTEVDVTQVRQIVMNLVINASEAIGTRSGVIAVSTGVMRAEAAYLKTVNYTPAPVPGDYVWVEISDDGCGMPPETLQRIFDPFFTTKFTGRGLGLAAVLGIVRGHKGAIKVYSEPGKGTTFKILFPIAEGPLTPAEHRVVTPPSWRGEGNILVIDDDETVRTLGARMLNRLGFTTTLFGDPREGLEAFEKGPDRFRLVLLDLTMPHLGGEETFRRLRAIQPGVRVILMSGFTEEDVTSRFAGKGLAGFVQKPFDSATLIHELRRVLEPPIDSEPV